MRFLIINRGVPHPESEDAIQKMYLLIQELYNKPEHTVDLALINLPDAYKNYKSLEIQKRDELDFKNEFKKINIDKIFLKSWVKFRNLNRSYLFRGEKILLKVARDIFRVPVTSLRNLHKTVALALDIFY